MAVLKADREYRRNIIFLYAIAVVSGYALIKCGLPEFNASLKQKKPAEAFSTLLFFLRVLFLSILPWSIYLFKYGRRILRTGQYPPSGAKVIRDTEIIEGRPAQRKAHVIIAGSLLLMVLALFSAIYFPYKLDKVFVVQHTSIGHETPGSDATANRHAP